MYRIEVFPQVFDARAEVKKKKFNSLGLNRKIDTVFLADVYTMHKQFSQKQLQAIAELLSNPVTQTFVIFSNKTRKQIRFPFKNKFNVAVEVGFLPGVTDNAANTAKEIIEDYLKIKFLQDEGVYSSQVLFIGSNITEKDIHTIAGSLINPLIQRVHVKEYKQFMQDHGMDIIVPQVRLNKRARVTAVNLNLDDDELITTGKYGIEDAGGTRRGPLALDLSYMKAIQKYFKQKRRNPTDIELESIAQTWSEHCKHTIFADPIDEIKDGLFKTYIKGATEKIIKLKKNSSNSHGNFCISVFTDNSGAIAFDENYLITHKVETHNSPSALDPFGGAITGIVGVNRDTLGFGLGAKPAVNYYGYCFGEPRDTRVLYRDQALTQKMLPPKRILQGVVEGVNAGGNCSGIPTPQGFVYFDDRYRGKPLVFVGTIGVAPRKVNGKHVHIKKANSSDYIIMVGGCVGLDGIHGATFSSVALDTASPATAVQIGDPITQKKFSDALIKEARDRNLYNSITDNGAGGLSCSVAEMAKESGGAKVYLEKVPLKYPGLDPWQIWISESQERMTLAVHKKKWREFSKLMKSRGVEATIIGEFTNSGKCVVFYKKKKIMDLDLEFLHNGLPKRPLKTSYVSLKHDEPSIPAQNNLTRTLFSLLSHVNIASYEFISQQYDHIVQGSTVLYPLQGAGRVNADTTVVRPVLHSEKGIVLSQGLYPRYSDIDTYYMAAASIDTAIRNIVSAGAPLDKTVLLDNFCWCSATEGERLGELKRAVKACYDYATSYETPFISGKDSMFNDFKGFDENGAPIKVSIPPTLLVTSLGIVNDVTKTITLDAKCAHDLIYVLGETFDELGGSEYFALFDNSIGNSVPKVNAARNKKLYKAYGKCADKKLIASAISISRGGLGAALAKMSMGGMLGVEITLKNISGKISRDDFALFSESQGRILVTVAPHNKKKFEKLMHGNSFKQIGKVISESRVIIKGLKGNVVVDTTVDKLLKAYRKTFENF